MMKIKLLKLLAPLVVLALLVPVGMVSAVVPLSIFFYGDATETGSPADVGTSVTAHVDTTQVASATITVAGTYYIVVPNQGEDPVTVVFKLDGVEAGQWTGITDGWLYPDGVELDLDTGAPVVRYGLTISVEPPEGGQVTQPGEGGFTYDAGEVVDLVAVASAGYRFTQWTGNVSAMGDPNSATTNITMNADYAIIANFVKIPAIQLAMILDGSGSIGSDPWEAIITGLASAVNNSACVPHDGTVELTVIQFGHSTQYAVLEVGPVVITSDNAATIAAQIQAIGYDNGPWTPMAHGIHLAADTLAASPNFDPGLKQALNLVTDGSPNVCDDTLLSCPSCPPYQENVVCARDYAIDTLQMTEGQDEIDAEGIGISDDNRDWLANDVIFPATGYSIPPGTWPPPEPGWIRVVEDAEEFAATLCEKMEALITRAPECDFTATPRTGMAPLGVRFTDLSIGEIDSWAWDFDNDGVIDSTQQNPSYTYTEAGRYTVSLTATGPGGSCTETKVAYIIVQELPTEVEEPANLVAAYLYISPEQVQPNQQVEISINIGNDGGTAGTRSIALYINGHLEDSQTVTVSPGSAKNVVFTVTKTEPGTYQVMLEGNVGQFTVLGTADADHWAGPLGTGGIIAIVVFVIVLVVALVFLLRRE